MSVLSWNVRGARLRTFPSLIRELKSKYRVQILLLVEPLISGHKASKVIRRMGFSSHHHVEAVGFSGGLWLLWDDVDFSLDILATGDQFIHARVVPARGEDLWFLTGVYGSPRLSDRDELWHNLRNLSQSTVGPWVLLGDFNAYIYSSEKWGGAPANTVAMRRFLDCVNDCALLDLGFSGPPFTWKGEG